MNEILICIKCGKEGDFRFRNDTQKYSNICKKCEKERRRKYYEDNKDAAIVYDKIYYENNKDSRLAYSRAYAQNNKPKRSKRHKERRLTDVFYRLRCDISRKIAGMLSKNKGSKQGKSVMNFLPYSIDELKEHLEFQFEPWMTWDNRGSYLSDVFNENDQSTWTWHIDHIVPQSALQYSSMIDDNFKKCWALTNLRPLKSLDNMKKGSKIAL